MNEAIPSQPVTSRVWVWRVLLGLLVVVLFARAVQARNAPFEQIDLAFENSDELLAWLVGLARRELVVYSLSFLLGLLTPAAVGRPIATLDRRSRWLMRAGTWGFGLATIAICLTIAWDEIPSLTSLLLPFLSYLAGAQLSSAAMRGVRPLAWAAGGMAAVGVLIVVAIFIALGMAISSEPLEIDATPLSTAGRRELTERIRNSRPVAGEPRRLRLTDAELSALVNSAIGRGAAGRQASLHFHSDDFTAQASLQLPRSDTRMFLNVRLVGHLSITSGHLRLKLDEVRTGDLAVPSALLPALSSFVHAMLMDEPQIHRIIAEIIEVKMSDGEINVALHDDALTRQIVPALVQLLWRRPDVAFETEQYLRRLTSVKDQAGADGDEHFASLMQAAFELAAKRSAVHDPRLENRAAIFALAILLGHAGLEPFVGELFDADLRARAEQMLGTVSLRGRSDFPRHFLVSAALALLSTEATSDRIGQMKEQLDSQAGGSGFSFADMQANMAGNRFAIAATRDETSACALQARVARGFDVDAFFPPVDGLPENMSAEEFQSRFGGVNGAGYRQMLDEINRRLDSSRAK